MTPVPTGAEQKGSALAALGLALIAGAWALVASGNEIAATFFYLPVWTGILAILDGLNYRLRGESPLLTTPGRLLAVAALSVPFWLLFEALNLRLANWSYQGLPQDPWLRWAGYLLAFGTVLPALEEARLLFGAAFPFDRLAWDDFRVSEGLRTAFTVLGWACLLLPLIAPGLFFPLVWAAVFLLLEPAAARRNPTESWLFELSLGRPGAVLSWAGGGLLCGLLWEAFNAAAGGRWTYLLPEWAGPKLFEMPLAGYLGFIPFGLSAGSLLALAPREWERITGSERLAWIFLLAFLSAIVLVGVDQATVASFADF